MKDAKAGIEPEVRLQKFLSEQGIASRRKCEEYILAGKVKVNGVVVTKLGTKIDPMEDQVTFEGKRVLQGQEEKIYVLLNKPTGYVTTAKDEFQRDTVMDLVKVEQRLVPVGRLDMYTSGALLLSNDGEFVNRITHPKHEIEKTYIVTVRGILTQKEIETLRQGVLIEDQYKTKPARVKILKIDEQKRTSRIEITIHEGKNRQVRKMCEAMDKKVLTLHRSKIGPVTVKDLKIGTWRYLTKREVNLLQ